MKICKPCIGCGRCEKNPFCFQRIVDKEGFIRITVSKCRHAESNYCKKYKKKLKMGIYIDGGYYLEKCKQCLKDK